MLVPISVLGYKYERDALSARSHRTLRDGSFGGRFPGTSCQATIGLSLQDEKYILRAEALIKLALIGFETLP